MPLHVSSTCAPHQEVKIALYSLWYHHTETSEWSKITKIPPINISTKLHARPATKLMSGRQVATLNQGSTNTYGTLKQ